MEQVDPTVLLIYRIFELSGIFLMAILGGQMARRREFDLFGFVIVSLVTALGGGIIRDAMIVNGPVAAVDHPYYLWVACAGALVAFLGKFHGRVWELFHVHADALVLGIWAVTGATKTMQMGLSGYAAVFMGLLTAVGGGVMADLLVGQTPQVLLGKRLYAAPAFISACIAVAFASFDYASTGMLVAPVVATSLAVLSYWRRWRIPFHYEFAPLNTAAGAVRSAVEPLEEGAREVARELEPVAVRKARHKALEKAQEELGGEP